MAETNKYDVVIAGGGLSGLSSAILLGRSGHKVLLAEKNYYPFHRVCGEYISEESRPFLASLGCHFPEEEFPRIKKLTVSAPNGRLLRAALTPGGFGVSRYRLDAMLASLAREAGVTIFEGSKVESIGFTEGLHQVKMGKQEWSARLVLGAFGKRSNLDIKWNRPFIAEKPNKLNNYVAVKYHIRYNMPVDEIALHNFRFGYCGISAVEDGRHCLCYMTRANNLGLSNNNLGQLEKNILGENPELRSIWENAEFLMETPLSISQISFSPKSKLLDHVLMGGDAAGLITPLCGNGMSIALQSGKMLAQFGDQFLKGMISRREMERNYRRQWTAAFSGRLFAGRMIQSFFGDPKLSGLLVKVGDYFPGMTQFLINKTHGEAY